jgi:hypothetical protein
MSGKRARLLQASVVLGAAGAGVALAAGPAAADTGALHVTPTTNLHDGQAVSVSWDTGQAWSGTNHNAAAFECVGPIPSGVLGGNPPCDVNTAVVLQAVQAADGDLAFQGTMTAHKSLFAGAATCAKQCSIVVVQQGGTFGNSSGSVPITFK